MSQKRYNLHGNHLFLLSYRRIYCKSMEIYETAIRSENDKHLLFNLSTDDCVFLQNLAVDWLFSIHCQYVGCRKAEMHNSTRRRCLYDATSWEAGKRKRTSMKMKRIVLFYTWLWLFWNRLLWTLYLYVKSGYVFNIRAT